MSFGRLEQRPGAKPMADINVTPLVDVMLVLLVIFIITAPLLSGSLALELPKADSAAPGAPTEAIRLALTPDGQVHLDERPITLDALRQALARRAAQDPDTELQLQADAQVPYGRVVELMDLAQQAGLSRIGFVAERRPAR